MHEPQNNIKNPAIKLTFSAHISRMPPFARNSSVSRFALIYVIILEVLHQIESNVIYPKIVGNSVGLPGLWVFAAVIIGGSLMGVTGMIIGVPLVATCYKLLMTDVEERLASNEGL